MRAKPQSFLRHREPVCQRFSNMQTQIYQSTLKLHNERLDSLVDDLETKFPSEPVHPKEEITSIMYKAGQASVVAYVKQLLEE
jgi:hypothetical protein